MNNQLNKACKEIYLAGGCFWGQSIFSSRLKG